MTPENQRMIDRLAKSARNAANATNVAQREAARTFLVRRADEVRVVREAMRDKLERQWRWFDAIDEIRRAEGEQGPDTSEVYVSRENQAITLLHDYEAVCDALDNALSMWLGSEVA